MRLAIGSDHAGFARKMKLLDHLAEAGHPVLGDKLYGNAGSSRRFPRVALHAATLGFLHPHTGEQKSCSLEDFIVEMKNEV